MSILTTHAAWILIAAFLISMVYEFYRATYRAGTSRHDSMRQFISQLVTLYAAAAAVISLLLLEWRWAAVTGLVFSGTMILVSLFYYNPKVMLDRRPGLVDWLEDLLFTGLLFVAAALLGYDVAGVTVVGR